MCSFIHAISRNSSSLAFSSISLSMRLFQRSTFLYGRWSSRAAPLTCLDGINTSSHINNSKVHCGSTSTVSQEGAATANRNDLGNDCTKEQKMIYRPRWRYTSLFRSKSLTDFLWCDRDKVVSIAHSYKHATEDITVTLIPVRHFAHPLFFKQVDELCSQHESVLMEGRVPLTHSPYSTFVPPREKVDRIRPIDQEDDEGWEPREVEKFFQPFSWGVRDSPNATIVHAADKYDYEKLPIWASVRFNAPIIGSLAREQHCLDMVYPLHQQYYKSFAIPWGAAHMPVFHEMLLDNGFEPVAMCSLLVLQRIDGTVSEGECDAVWSAQRWRERRIYIVYIIGAYISLKMFASFVRVRFASGPEAMG